MVYVKIMLQHVDDHVRCWPQTLQRTIDKNATARRLYKTPRPAQTIHDFKIETQRRRKDTNPTSEI